MLKLENILSLFRLNRAPSEERLREDQELLDKERQGVLNHAYGFVSRGNRAAGIRHIEQYLEEGSWDAAAGIWFFDAMTEWEHPDAALAFGRDLIGRLLRGGYGPEARKVLLRCRSLDDRFLPRPEDQIPLSAETTRP